MLEKSSKLSVGSVPSDPSIEALHDTLFPYMDIEVNGLCCAPRRSTATTYLHKNNSR